MKVIPRDARWNKNRSALIQGLSGISKEHGSLLVAVADSDEHSLIYLRPQTCQVHVQAAWTAFYGERVHTEHKCEILRPVHFQM